MKSRSPAAPRTGMSLVELLIVLGLMAAMAAVALTTLDGMGDRTRMDTTRNRLDMIEEAIVGDGLNPGRFISDMGRLPVVHDQIPDPDDPAVIRDVQAGEGLIELWSSLAESYASAPAMGLFNGFEWNGTAYVSEAIYTADMCSGGTLPQDPTGSSGMSGRFPLTGLTAPESALSVNVPGGWQGPYLQLGGERLFDGFGNSFQFTQEQPPYPPRRTDLIPPIIWRPVTHVQLLDKIEITGVASYGRDNLEDSTVVGEAHWTNRDEVRLLDSGKSRATLVVSMRLRTISPVTGGLVSPVAETIDDRKDEEDYTVNTVVRAGSGANPDDLYICTQPGKSGESPPVTWDRSDAVEDDEVLWEFWQYLPISGYMNRMRVVLFMPFADPDYSASVPMRTRIVTAWNDDGTTHQCADSESSASPGAYCAPPIYKNVATDDDLASRRIVFQWTDIHSVELGNLPPGIRKIFVYGYHETTSSEIKNSWSSGLQTIELKPGVNHITVYLNQPL